MKNIRLFFISVFLAAGVGAGAGCALNSSVPATAEAAAATLRHNAIEHTAICFFMVKVILIPTYRMSQLIPVYRIENILARQ